MLAERYQCVLNTNKMKSKYEMMFHNETTAEGQYTEADRYAYDPGVAEKKID